MFESKGLIFSLNLPNLVTHLFYDCKNIVSGSTLPKLHRPVFSLRRRLQPHVERLLSPIREVATPLVSWAVLARLVRCPEAVSYPGSPPSAECAPADGLESFERRSTACSYPNGGYFGHNGNIRYTR